MRECQMNKKGRSIRKHRWMREIRYDICRYSLPNTLLYLTHSLTFIIDIRKMNEWEMYNNNTGRIGEKDQCKR